HTVGIVLHVERRYAAGRIIPRPLKGNGHEWTLVRHSDGGRADGLRAGHGHAAHRVDTDRNSARAGAGAWADWRRSRLAAWRKGARGMSALIIVGIALGSGALVWWIEHETEALWVRIRVLEQRILE